jgi:hypothetical protein
MPAAGWKACPTSDTTWRAQEKQTTENTENTEKTNHGGHGDGKEGADTLGGIYAAA